MNEVLLFTTPTCVHCPGIKKKLIDNQIVHTLVDATKYPDMTRQFAVRSVPTVVVINELHQPLFVNVGSNLNIEELKGIIGV